MPYSSKIVPHCRNGYTPRLDTLIEAFILDGVLLVGVVGPECARVEEIIDEIVVGKGDRNYDLLTSSHPGQSVEEAVQFAISLTGELAGEPQVVEL